MSIAIDKYFAICYTGAWQGENLKVQCLICQFLKTFYEYLSAECLHWLQVIFIIQPYRAFKSRITTIFKTRNVTEDP